VIVLFWRGEDQRRKFNLETRKPRKFKQKFKMLLDSWLPDHQIQFDFYG
jgi:hypothetical protein